MDEIELEEAIDKLILESGLTPKEIANVISLMAMRYQEADESDKLPD
jgi:hypothetical protein